MISCLVSILEIIKKLSCSAREITEEIISVGERRNGSRNYQQASQHKKDGDPCKLLVGIARIATAAAFGRTVILANTAAEKTRRY